MAEGLLRHPAGDRFQACSAGTEPKGVARLTVEVMEETGIDIRGQRSQSVEEFAGERFDYVITVCDSARERCPAFPGGGKRIHWSVEDPAEAEGREELEASQARPRRPGCPRWEGTNLLAGLLHYHSSYWPSTTGQSVKFVLQRSTTPALHV
jgi:arsenate reductase